MEISSIRLTNYRNYAEQSLSLRPGINVLTGGNAQGRPTCSRRCACAR